MKEYCRYCGEKLVEQKPITADNFGGGLPFFIPSPYDPKTGKLRMRKWVACPNKKKNIWKEFNGEFEFYHDSHAIGNEYLVDST